MPITNAQIVVELSTEITIAIDSHMRDLEKMLTYECVQKDPATLAYMTRRRDAAAAFRQHPDLYTHLYEMADRMFPATGEALATEDATNDIPF